MTKRLTNARQRSGVFRARRVRTRLGSVGLPLTFFFPFFPPSRILRVAKFTLFLPFPHHVYVHANLQHLLDSVTMLPIKTPVALPSGRFVDILTFKQLVSAHSHANVNSHARDANARP